MWPKTEISFRILRWENDPGLSRGTINGIPSVLLRGRFDTQRNFFLSQSGVQKSKLSITGLRSQGVSGVTVPREAPGEKCVPRSHQLLVPPGVP